MWKREVWKREAEDMVEVRVISLCHQCRDASYAYQNEKNSIWKMGDARNQIEENRKCKRTRMTGD